MNRDVIVALDFKNREETFEFLDKLQGETPYVKVGMELYYAEGAEIVREMVKRGYKVFLDLKLHDIPNTVKSATKVLSDLGAEIINVHASGTVNMMRAAKEALVESGSKALLIAVTQLTSTSQQDMEHDLLIKEPIENVVLEYAKRAKEAGLDGIVCSPHEVEKVKAACGADFLTVTPGIRFADSKADDQQRIMTPAKARETGTDFIVVGRPITRAENPLEAYRKCRKEFCND